MSKVETDPLADLAEWEKVNQELKRLKAHEGLLRRRLFATFFPKPKEGTNNYDLAQGYVLKGKHVILRDIDPGSLTALAPTLKENGISVPKLIKYEPSLVLKEYRTLTDEERNLFDRVLIVKDGSPQMEIVLPAKARPKGEQ